MGNLGNEELLTASLIIVNSLGVRPPIRILRETGGQRAAPWPNQ